MRPPMRSRASSTRTETPASARRLAAESPAAPAPTIRTSVARLGRETVRSGEMAFGIVFGLVVLVGGLAFAFGLMGDQKIVIAVGLLILSLCAIFGVQPDWPVKRRSE